ncbi:MAG: rod shape-determining protein MreD [Bacteroidales bacterium]|nr:rod shape-determining protein MreD [Bacteroidales bacterium]
MKQNFYLQYVLLVVAQILICNFFHFTPYVTLSILPVLALCVPVKVSTPAGLMIAFATGLAVDFLAEGVVGINTFALVSVALVRRGLVRRIFGEELIVRGENFSVRRAGPLKVTFAIFLVQTLFMVLYIWADGASARPFSFNLWRVVASIAAGVLIGFPIADMLTPEDRR